MWIKPSNHDRCATFSPGWLRGACMYAACGWLAGGATQGSPAHADAKGAPTTQAEVDIARFAGGHITLADVQTVIAQQVPLEQARIARPGGVQELVERMIRYDLLALEAEARGYAGKVAVHTALKQKAIEQMLADRTHVDPKSIPADEVARARKEHEAEFSRPARRRAAHIRVATRKEALDLIAELRHKSHQEFARVAGDRSLDDGTRKQGGELGYFAESGEADRGNAVPTSLAAAAFSIKHVGDLAAEPIAQSDGYSVLMLTGLKPAFTTPDAEIDEQLREQLATAKQKQQVDALMQALQAEYAPTVHSALVEHITLPAADDTRAARNPEGFPVFPPDPREPPKLVAPDGI